MKKIIGLVLVILVIASVAMIRADLTRSVNLQRTMSTVGAGAVFRSGGVYIGPGLRSHMISWQVSGGTLSACAIKLEKSTDGTTWTDLIVNHICTSNGASAVVEDQAPQIRMNLTTFTRNTGTAVLIVNYGGYIDAPDINMYGTKQLWRSVTSSVATTAPNDIIASSSNMGYCLTSISTYNSSATATVLNVYENYSTLKGVLAAPAGGGAAWSFPSPLCVGVGSRVTVMEAATAATIYVTISYFMTPSPPDTIATTTSSSSSTSTSSTSTSSTSTSTSSTSSTSTSTSSSLAATTTTL